MVSVSIFALRDVIRQVQSEFRTSYNGQSHTSPSTAADLQILADYLKTQRLQSYFPAREHNDEACEARDLIHEGGKYPNKPSAFRVFSRDQRKTTNLGNAEDAPTASPAIPSATQTADEEQSEDLSEEIDADIEFDDLLLDDDEYPFGVNVGDYMESVQHVIDEYAQYE